jgi:hypothetical protein
MQSRKVNLTVSLPAKLLREARLLAAARGMSLSDFLALLLGEQMAAEPCYRAARDRQLRLLREGLPLGTGGAIGWRREELHER